MEQHAQNGWSEGDRVYLVAHPALTGTVLGNVAAGTRVHLDIYPEVATWIYGARELECYTRSK